MTYGTEVRENTNKTKHMLRVAEMKTLRTIEGKQEETEWETKISENNAGNKILWDGEQNVRGSGTTILDGWTSPRK